MENIITERICCRCKESKTLDSNNFYSKSSAKYGFDYRCKNCCDCRKREPQPRTANRILKEYKKADKQKGRENDLTQIYIQEQLLKPCIYCGYQSTGLDRKDNSVGHLQENCVPCCMECNISRNNNFTSEEMVIIGEAIKWVKDARIGKLNPLQQLLS